MSKQRLETIEVRRLQGFTIVENAMLEDGRLSRNAMMVYIALARHADQEKKCWPSWKRIGEVARCSRASVHTAIAELILRGYLLKTSRVGASCFYILTTPVQILDPPRPNIGPPPVQILDPEQDPIEQDIGTPADTSARAIKRHKTPPDPAIKRLVDHYHDAYLARCREEPTVTGQWGKNLKTLLRVHSEEQIRRVIDYFFAYDKRTRFSFGAFMTAFDNLLPAALGKHPARAGPVAEEWTCPDCGTVHTSSYRVCECGYGR